MALQLPKGTAFAREGTRATHRLVQWWVLLA
jgi:hypothetical protein